MPLSIPGAELISPEAAHDLIEPVLKPHLSAADLKFALDRELSLDDEYDRRRVLALPDGAVVPSNLVLDFALSPYDSSGWRGIVALGRLTVEGDILAENMDGGPFLVTRGDVSVRHIIKAGAPLAAGGRITASGIVYCCYNHGSFRALGGLTAKGLIIDDPHFQLKGSVDAVTYIGGVDSAAEKFVPDLLEEDEDGIRLMDDASEEIITRMKGGRDVLLPHAVRTPPSKRTKRPRRRV